jgi:rhodanese-related sulfurtransferase
VTTGEPGKPPTGGTDTGYPHGYPTGNTDRGIQVSALTAEQRELARAAITSFAQLPNTTISGSLLESYLSKLPKRKEVVAYCRGPYCLMSFDAVETLRKRGWKARRLRDGFPEWRAAGLPVER